MNQKSQGNQGKHGSPPNAPQGPQPNLATQQQGDQPKKKNPLRSNKPCSCCNMCGHYTHECTF